jgi:hypothetical protein
MTDTAVKRQVKTIRVSLKCPSSERYKKALSILSAILPQHLTEKEMKIISLLYELEGERVLNTEKRKVIREALQISDNDMNNYVRQLKNKSVLKEIRPKEIGLNPLLNITLNPGEGFVLAFIVDVDK